MGEQPPPGFEVVTTYISPRGQLFHKVDVYIATLGALADLALEDFQAAKKRDEFNSMPRIQIEAGGASYQVKTIMWTLYTVNKFMLLQNEYAAANFQTKVGDKILGFGRYILKKEVLKNAPSLTAMADSNITESNVLRRREDIGNELIPVTSITISNRTSTTLTISGKHEKGIKLNLTYLPGRDFHSHEILQVMQKLVIDIGEADFMNVCPGIAFYSPEGDLTIAVHGTSEAGKDKFKNYMAVFALQALAGGLAEDRRWQVCGGLIRWDGEIVGKFSVTEGSPLPPPPEPRPSGVIVTREETPKNH